MPPDSVLIVDDDPLIGWALQREISALNVGTRVVGTAREALGELGRQPYATVILDIHLPDGDGIDLLAEIGVLAPGARVILMSADNSETTRTRAFAAGAVQFLEKPFDTGEIRSLLRDLSADYPRKRKHLRYLCRVPLRISVVDLAPEKEQITLHIMSGLMTDVSEGGLKVATDYPLQVGQSVRTRIEAANDPFRKFVAPDTAARVVWVAPREESDRVWAGLEILS